MYQELRPDQQKVIIGAIEYGDRLLRGQVDTAKVHMQAEDAEFIAMVKEVFRAVLQGHLFIVNPPAEQPVAPPIDPPADPPKEPPHH